MFAKICEELALLQESRNRTIADYLYLPAGELLLEPGMVRERESFNSSFAHALLTHIRLLHYPPTRLLLH